MPRYIDADKLKNHVASFTGMFTDELGFVVSLEAVLRAFDFAPTADVVEVVRCKDCKHFKTDTDYCKEHNKGYCEWDSTIKSRKHFCGYGERKEK